MSSHKPSGTNGRNYAATAKRISHPKTPTVFQLTAQGWRNRLAWGQKSRHKPTLKVLRLAMIKRIQFMMRTLPQPIQG